MAQLRVAYGEAVARVPGAENEDLLILHNLGLLLSDPPDEEPASADPVPAPAASPKVLSSLSLAEEGLAAQRRGDLDEAIRCFTGVLDGGHLDADLEAEVMYWLGVAVKQQGDLESAARWFRRAAEAGSLEAAATLGLTMGQAMGQQVKPDEAIRWLTVAAEGGHVRAMAGLGALLRVRSFDLIERGALAAGGEAAAQGWAWIRKAAEAGEPTALSLVAEADANRREHERTAQSAAGPQRTTAPAKGACYIATAVYGSYDSEPVLTLRRFRDEHLARSATGRAFIRVYYTLSPHLARHFESAGAWNRAARRVLDALVRLLDARS
ncbi:sel1 repeat family protein [Nocardioides guangzhouensis]|uniref:Sel1 repeat family protein n=1 Tax=Nocardioides guangzhouensis TaxID=2497878 RepID=A0A4Q4ZAI8_9ACTN|nr:CFI-box-CTERM domain-containing protein [Nocardioides guangzhouensis]RYP84226.1 sel1 repeat family protein [Nocardioides guangzhouensis]